MQSLEIEKLRNKLAKDLEIDPYNDFVHEEILMNVHEERMDLIFKQLTEEFIFKIINNHKKYSNVLKLIFDSVERNLEFVRIDDQADVYTTICKNFIFEYHTFPEHYIIKDKNRKVLLDAQF